MFLHRNRFCKRWSAKCARKSERTERGKKLNLLRLSFHSRYGRWLYRKLKKTANKLNIFSRTSQPRSRYFSFVCKHKLFWPETCELKQERRLLKYFFNLDLTLNVTRNFKEHLFEHLKPIYSDLAQTFLDVHLQFVSVPPLCSILIYSLAPECFLFICNRY